MKTILITGASAGIGLATAKLLANEKHKLIMLARRLDRLKALQRSLPTETHIAGVDVTSKTQVQRFFAALPEPFRDIDVVVNNAGMALGMEPAQASKLENWEQTVDTNVKGVLYVTRPILDIMTKRGSGLIINIGSIASTISYQGGNVYGGTKAFIRQFSRNLRTDLLGTGVKVTNIEPGRTETEFFKVRFQDEQRARDFYRGWRALQPEDVAQAVAWVIHQPAHVNIDTIEITPLDQTFGGFASYTRS